MRSARFCFVTQRVASRSSPGQERSPARGAGQGPQRQFPLPVTSGPRSACARTAACRVWSPAGGPVETTSPRPVTAELPMFSQSSRLIRCSPYMRHMAHGATDDQAKQGHPSRGSPGNHAGVLGGRASHPGAPHVTLPVPPRSGTPGTRFAYHRDGRDGGSRTACHTRRRTTDGFSSTYPVPGPGDTAYHDGVCECSSGTASF